jgi:DNA-binding NarL/FixJ family response regulator
MVSVVLVDDEELVREGLAMLLSAETDLQVVGQASSPAAALALVRRRRPDVVVLDVRMPAGSGTDIVAGLVAAGGGAVLMLTSFNVAEDVRSAVVNGAAGFLLKHNAPATLSAAVRAVARGEGWLDPAVVRPLLADLRPLAATDTVRRIATLSDRERQVLLLVARGRSNREIAKDLHLAESTVKTHVTGILTRLGVRDRVQAALAAYQAGLVDR